MVSAFLYYTDQSKISWIMVRQGTEEQIHLQLSFRILDLSQA